MTSPPPPREPVDWNLLVFVGLMLATYVALAAHLFTH